MQVQRKSYSIHYICICVHWYIYLGPCHSILPGHLPREWALSIHPSYLGAYPGVGAYPDTTVIAFQN